MPHRREPRTTGTLTAMPPIARHRARVGRLVPIVLAVMALLVAACSASSPALSFDPASPCTTDGQQPGAYPDLESLLPADVLGAKPDHVDSGRTCTPEGLGTLSAAGITEVRFAGATWGTGGSSGWTVAAFKGDGLTADKLMTFYESGARSDTHTEKVTTSDTAAGNMPAKRLDVLQSNGTGQTIVTWQKPSDTIVWVLLAADVGDTKVAQLLEALGTR
jgi:hypothetical protein